MKRSTTTLLCKTFKNELKDKPVPIFADVIDFNDSTKALVYFFQISSNHRNMQFLATELLKQES